MSRIQLIVSVTLFLILASPYSWASEQKTWGSELGAKTRSIGSMELVYWGGESNADYASEVLEWFSQLPYYEEAFDNGKVIIAPNNKQGGIHLVLKKMAGREVHSGYKETEGTAIRKGKWPPPFHTFPFVIISSESIGRYNVGLLHELLHHYYWSMPRSIVSEIEKIHDTFLASSGAEFRLKGDPGHVYVWSCQYFPLGYQSVTYEHFPSMANICKSTLGEGRVAQRGTLENGVRQWAANFVNRQGMALSAKNGVNR